MKMIDGLPRPPAVIDDKPESVGGLQPLRDHPCRLLKMPQKLRIFLAACREARNMLFGNDQDVGRRLGINILERHRPLILKDQLRGYLLPDYLTKYAVGQSRNL